MRNPGRLAGINEGTLRFNHLRIGGRNHQNSFNAIEHVTQCVGIKHVTLYYLNCGERIQTERRHFR